MRYTPSADHPYSRDSFFMRWPRVRGALGFAASASAAAAPVRRGREEWKNLERRGWNRSFEAGFVGRRAPRALLALK